MIAQAGESFVNQWFDAYWLVLVTKVAIVLVFFLVAPLGVGYAEHKVLAHMQARLGPMYAGRFHGWAQLIADGAKFVQKEDVIPAAADRWVFSLAPAVALVPYIELFVVIQFSDEIFILNLDVGIFFVMAITSVTVIGVLMAGWASANKFSLIGALRAAAAIADCTGPSPSRSTTARRSVSFLPMKEKFSGSTARQAPRSRASRSSRRAVARFASTSASEVICRAATTG